MDKASEQQEMDLLTPGEASNWRDAINNLQDYESRLYVAETGLKQAQESLKRHLDKVPGDREDSSPWFTAKRSLQGTVQMHQDNVQRNSKLIPATQQTINSYYNRANERKKSEQYRNAEAKMLAKAIVDEMLERGLVIDVRIQEDV